jgi:DNA-binding HxlR family transcriptional regulator
VVKMAKKLNDAARDKRVDELSLVGFELDDICSEIWLTLMAYKRLRFNLLHKRLKQFGTDISKPSLLEHLNHLIERKLIERREEGFQNVSYGLTDEIRDLLHVPEEDIKSWFEDLKKTNERLPPHLRSIEFYVNEYYNNMTDEQLRKEIDRELNTSYGLFVHELKNFVQYDLKLDKTESDADFWKLVGNPMYRLHERSVVENCRNSERYKEKLFEEIDFIIRLLKHRKYLEKG